MIDHPSRRGYHAQFAMNSVLNQFQLPRRFHLCLRAFNILVFVATIGAFLHAGTWLVREDPVQKAQIVVVLSGGLPERALAAADEFKTSGAKEVWLTRPLQPGAAMEQLHLPYAGEEQY